MRPALLPLALFIALACPAYAKDSIATVAAGALALEKTDKIELRSEDLYLSTKEIRVTYRFFNKSSRDLRARIVLPVPDLTGESEKTIDAAGENDSNFRRLEIRVGGKPVVLRTEKRAFYKPEGGAEVEITRNLANLGVPLLPTWGTSRVVQTMPEATIESLVSHRYVSTVKATYADGTEDTSYWPMWTLRSKYYFQAIFPAGSEVVVEQRYQPAISYVWNGTLGSGRLTNPEKDHYSKEWCTEPDFTKDATSLTKASYGDQSGKLQIREEQVSAVIMPMMHRASRIGDFRLVIDKGFADNLVSFCGLGVKIGPTEYEMRFTDYLPDRNIDVLILQRHLEP